MWEFLRRLTHQVRPHVERTRHPASKRTRGGVTTTRWQTEFHIHWNAIARPRGPGLRSARPNRLRDFFIGASPPPPLSNAQMLARLAREEAQHAARRAFLREVATRYGPDATRDQVNAALARDAALRQLEREADGRPPRRTSAPTGALPRRPAPVAPRPVQGPKAVKVSPYVKANGTAVKGHRRVAPGMGEG